MEIVHSIHYHHLDKDYTIQFEKGPYITKGQVYLTGTTDPLYSYRLGLSSCDHPDPKKMRMFWFIVATRAFDFINAQA